MTNENDDPMVLPDGSAFATASFPLPKDHWLYSTDADGFAGPPPMPFRMGEVDDRRPVFETAIRAAAQYAVRASTRCGRDDDFDPDALVQNMIVGLIGYHTSDGLDPQDSWANPSPVPPLFPAEPVAALVFNDATAGDTQDALPSTGDARAPAPWKLVPVEPTKEMIEEGHRHIDWCRNGQNTTRPGHPSQKLDGVGTDCGEDVQDAYRAMLSAAPAPPAGRRYEDGLIAALEEIARQKKTDELETAYDVEVADFEGGYDACIDRARKALEALTNREGA